MCKFQRTRKGKRSSHSTKMEKLLHVLHDGHWHSTKQLVRRVGHTFAVAKFKLVNYGYPIERQGHPTKKHQHQYRLTDLPQEGD